MNLMQVRGVNAFTCTEAKVSIDHELTHERSTTKGKKIHLWTAKHVFIICYLNASWIKIKIILDG